MRDIILTAFIFGSLPFILRRPQLGVAMYIWISVMNPHRLTWSFAYDMGFASIVAVATLMGTFFSKDLKPPPMNAPMIALILFGAWTGVTTVFALHPQPAYELWARLMKTLVMACLIPMLFHDKKDLRLLVWVLVVSIAYYGTKGGIWTLITGGSARVYGPPGSYIEDNNYLAVAIIMMIPLMRYLQLTSVSRPVRWALGFMMLCCAVAVLGTYSRGALLAVIAMGVLLWWKGKQKVPLLIVGLLAVPFALTSMPEKWHQRMETIKTYREDGSANRRLNSWGTMWNLAKDRPAVGGGFEVATREVYARYAPDPSVPPQVAHSIYFQALGEHGFVGLALYLLLLASLWRKAMLIIRAVREPPDGELAWAREFALMAQVTLVGFAVGGAFLSLVNYDVPYYLVGLVVATVALIDRHIGASNARTATVVDVSASSTRAVAYRAQ
jgi:probable O-glycosylation ligase (exosortase A-associated)